MLLDACAKCVGALGANQGVRVFAVWQKQKACSAAILQIWQRRFECAPGGLAAGRVAIEAEQYARHYAK